jgi:hypothetical protein
MLRYFIHLLWTIYYLFQSVFLNAIIVRLLQLRGLLHDHYWSHSWAHIHDGQTMVREILSLQRSYPSTTRYREKNVSIYL